MARKAKGKRGRCAVGKSTQANEWLVSRGQVRQKWLGKLVAYEVSPGGGVLRGRVTSISDEGDVVVETLPAYAQRFPALFLSVGSMDRVLTLVDE